MGSAGDRVVVRNWVVRAWQALLVVAAGAGVTAAIADGTAGSGRVILLTCVWSVVVVGAVRALRVAWISDADGMVVRNLVVSSRIPWSNVRAFSVDEDPFSEGKFGPSTWRRHVRVHARHGGSVRIRATLCFRRRRAERIAALVHDLAAEHGLESSVTARRLRSGDRRQVAR